MVLLVVIVIVGGSLGDLRQDGLRGDHQVAAGVPGARDRLLQFQIFLCDDLSRLTSQRVRTISSRRTLLYWTIFSVCSQHSKLVTEQIWKIQLTILQICWRSNLRERCWVDWFTALRFHFLAGVSIFPPSFLLVWLFRVTELNYYNEILRVETAARHSVKLNKLEILSTKKVCPQFTVTKVAQIGWSVLISISAFNLMKSIT